MKRNKLKKVAGLVLLSIISFYLVSCGGVKDIKLSQVVEEIESLKYTTSNMKEAGKKELKRFYKLNSKDFNEVLLYIPSSSMNVEEMLLIKVKDKSQIDGVESAIENRVNNQLKSFNGYGIEQTALLNDYELKIIGNCIFFCVGKNSADMADAFRSVVE